MGQVYCVLCDEPIKEEAALVITTDGYYVHDYCLLYREHQCAKCGRFFLHIHAQSSDGGTPLCDECLKIKIRQRWMERPYTYRNDTALLQVVSALYKAKALYPIFADDYNHALRVVMSECTEFASQTMPVEGSIKNIDTCHVEKTRKACIDLAVAVIRFLHFTDESMCGTGEIG